jgi:hypothetical protein
MLHLPQPSARRATAEAAYTGTVLSEPSPCHHPNCKVTMAKATCYCVVARYRHPRHPNLHPKLIPGPHCLEGNEEPVSDFYSSCWSSGRVARKVERRALAVDLPHLSWFECVCNLKSGGAEIQYLRGRTAGPGGEVVELGRGAEALIDLSSVICKV